MYRIVGSLVEIARLAGVEFEFGTAVEKILVDGYEAKGVVLDDGRCLNADFVVANADLPLCLPGTFTTRSCLPRYGAQTLLLLNN